MRVVTAGIVLVVVWLGVLFTPADQPGLPTKLANITLDDLEGRKWTLYDIKDAKAVVLFFMGIECPMANRYIGRLNALSQRNLTKGVIVLAVNPSGLVPVEAIAKHARETRLTINVLLDPQQKLADQLKVEMVPTVVVVDGDWKIRYRGQFDDSKLSFHVKKQYVQDAVTAILAGEEVSVRETEPFGCMIERTVKQTSSTITYAEHIAPILNRHCLRCHRPGEAAPFALTTYDQAHRWSRTIKVITQARLMPPWQPLNHDVFRDERYLTDAERAMLAKWADAGAPLGDPGKVPPVPPATTGWHLGEPDLVLTAPEFEMPAGGDDEFRCYVLPTGLTKDAWVRSVEVRPENKRVVHHVNLYLDTSGAAEKLDAADPAPGYRSSGTWPGFSPAPWLDSWTAGQTPLPLPDGVGRLLPANARLVLEVHYQPTGRLEKDRMRLGLHLAKKPVQQPLHWLVLANSNFLIPANEPRRRVTAELPVDDNIQVLALRPAMHFLGREMKVEAVLPDQTRQTLLHILPWDFHRQEMYRFTTPVRLPKGARLQLEAVYDNTLGNPNQPRLVPKDVVRGLNLTDERCEVLIACIQENAKNAPPLNQP